MMFWTCVRSVFGAMNSWAQISGVDLTGPLGDAVLSELRVALHDYKVSATTGPTPG